MAYSDELLKTADLLLGLQPVTQANLRRSVSTGYYALFHLLIEDACLLWDEPGQRSRLARQFDHKRMREASAMAVRAAVNQQSVLEQRIITVAEAFVQCQNSRHEADYNLRELLSPEEAAFSNRTVHEAFKAWQEIRRSETARDFLFSLLFRDKY